MYITYIFDIFYSIIGDFLTKENSKFYMARPDNLFNVLFVKWSWGWTLTFVSLFVGLTSFTTSCGRKDIIKNQGIRLVIGKYYQVHLHICICLYLVSSRDNFC